jgi:hypothetical protein
MVDLLVKCAPTSLPALYPTLQNEKELTMIVDEPLAGYNISFGFISVLAATAARSIFAAGQVMYLRCLFRDYHTP